ncbi:MAG: single-stranded DNA-binding protein [Acidothermus sp.]|nr:single-stranded DNA-binding protein [Acidothermus sp.]
MFDPQVTLVGNLVADPRLNFTAEGHAVASFRIAATPRRFDRQTEQWRDGDTVFASVRCWRTLAENVAASLRRGQSVVVIGRLTTRWYETKDGHRREGVEIEAAAVGPDLSRAVAVVKRAERGAGLAFPRRDDSDAPVPADGGAATPPVDAVSVVTATTEEEMPDPDGVYGEDDEPYGGDLADPAAEHRRDERATAPWEGSATVTSLDHRLPIDERVPIVEGAAPQPAFASEHRTGERDAAKRRRRTA